MTVKAVALNDKAWARWTALALLALAMFCSYIFMDILSPIKNLLQETRGWDSLAFGTMQGSETFLNVFIFFLIFAGVILDKMGVRFTALLSGAVMLVGATINWYALTDSFCNPNNSLYIWFTDHLNYIPLFDELGVSPFYKGMPASAKFSAIGFMIFGCGVEMAGITVSRGIVKWFKGREMALAMGSEMALARLGVATCMIFSPLFANLGGEVSVSRSVAFGVVLLLIALIMFIVYFFMDRKLDMQTGAEEEKDDPFKISDLGKILSSSGFWLVALLCVLYYSAIFPFQKYAVNMLQCNINFTAPDSEFWASSEATIIQYIVMLVVAAAAFASNFQSSKLRKSLLMCLAIVALVAYCFMGYKCQSAAAMFAVFPLLAVGITPILGHYVDYKGKAASMLVFGSLLLIICHLTFAFILPQFKEQTAISVTIAYVTILVLGASFSLVPASLWPSVPKLVDSKIIGSAYALIFWIQNIGLWLFPLLIGKVLDNTNPDITRGLANGTLTPEQAAVSYNYTAPLVMLACLGVAALLLGLVLKVVDRKKHLGLEEPNIKPNAEVEESEVITVEG
ncbi:MAG: MFS transporter [Firmicutes bacterium]|nr:MFS transporter [Bacillota bacterium]MCM1402139.1 MFS transporter [Bacteroides sp.]MCM1478038.1 MFS transporter [Bacteroides sp.]